MIAPPHGFIRADANNEVKIMNAELRNAHRQQTTANTHRPTHGFIRAESPTPRIYPCGYL